MRISEVISPKVVEFLALLLLFLLTLFLRSELIFSNPTLSGSDAGNMLAFAHAILGNNVKPFEVAYPPVIPTLLAGLVTIFGDITALKVLASALSILSGVPFYLIARRIAGPWAALTTTLIFLSSEINTNTLAWSGYPQLLGLTILLFTLYFLNRSIEESNRLNIIISSLFMSLVFGTSHFVFIVLMGIILFYVIWLIIFEYSKIKRWLITLIIMGILFLIFSLPYFNTYIIMFNGMAHITTNMHSFPNSTLLLYFSNTSRYIFGAIGFPIFWYMLFYLAIITPFFTFFRTHGKRNTIFYCVTFYPPLLLHLWFQEIRFLSFALIGMSFSLAMLLAQLHTFIENTRERRVLLVLLVISILTVSTVVFVSSENKFGEAINYYQSFDNDAKDALDWLRLNTPKDSVIATPEWTIGWWIEGYAQRHTIWGGPPSWLTFSIERKNAEIANLIFQEAVDIQFLKILLKENNISYLLLDKSLNSYGVPQTEESGNIFLDSVQGFHMIFENSRFIIIDTREAV